MIDLGLTRSSLTLMLCSLFFNAGAQGQEPKPAKEPSFYYGPPIKVDDHVTVTVEKHGRDTITLSGTGFEEFTLPGKVIADEGGFELIIPYTVSRIAPAVTENVAGGDYGSMKQEKTPSVQGKSYKFELDKSKFPHAPDHGITISRNNKEIVTFTAEFSCKGKSVGIVIPLGRAGR